jgi:DNA-binding NarL/FixJ family response regulator
MPSYAARAQPIAISTCQARPPVSRQATVEQLGVSFDGIGTAPPCSAVFTQNHLQQGYRAWCNSPPSARTERAKIALLGELHSLRFEVSNLKHKLRRSSLLAKSATKPVRLDVRKVRRALIVEDEQEFQIRLTDALDQIPGNWRVFNYSLGQDALSFLDASNGALDLALIDLGLPDIEGTKIISHLRRAYPDLPILVVSVITSSNKLIEALHAGATGYILKDDEIFDLAPSIDQILKGHSPISPSMARGLIERLPAIPAVPMERSIVLTQRETELLECIVSGLNYAQAAQSMDLKISTVHSYSRTLFRKLGVQSQRQAVIMAQKHQLIPA